MTVYTITHNMAPQWGAFCLHKLQAMLLVTTLLLFSCNGRSAGSDAGTVPGVSDRPQSGDGSSVSNEETQQALEAGQFLFTGTDSIELYKYADPADQRTFSRVNTSDVFLIQLLVEDLRGEYFPTAVCPHSKKAYLFRNGEVFKTIYVSDSCRYLAYSVDGTQIFRKLSVTLHRKMQELLEKEE